MRVLGWGRESRPGTCLRVYLPPGSRMESSPSGRSDRAPSLQSSRKLARLPTLEEHLLKGCRGMVPMTSGSSKSSLEVPGMSTQTWKNEPQWRVPRPFYRRGPFLFSRGGRGLRPQLQPPRDPSLGDTADAATPAS